MKNYLTITAILGAITIILGAFGAHALKEKLSIDQLASFETAVKYQFYHVLVLLFVLTTKKLNLVAKKRLSWFFIAGIVFFSGSIYCITFGVPAASIWFITPFGGLLFIMGWLLMAYYFFKSKIVEN
jgi:uncharacterized membrane protein YgdD (TMEM256/DUF423 family)